MTIEFLVLYCRGPIGPKILLRHGCFSTNYYACKPKGIIINLPSMSYESNNTVGAEVSHVFVV